VAGRTKYEIWRSASPDSGFALVATTTSTSYKNAALVPNITYYYRIRAYRQCGSVPAYGEFSATVSARPTFGAVTGASAARASATGVKISWGKVAGKKAYEVYRATSPDGPFALLKSTTGQSLADSRLTTGVTYYYKVVAYCMVGKARYYGGESAVVSATP
jgi:fibronectin type 3 domain-containing protein